MKDKNESRSRAIRKALEDTQAEFPDENWTPLDDDPISLKVAERIYAAAASQTRAEIGERARKVLMQVEVQSVTPRQLRIAREFIASLAEAYRDASPNVTE